MTWMRFPTTVEMLLTELKAGAKSSSGTCRLILLGSNSGISPSELSVVGDGVVFCLRGCSEVLLSCNM